MKSSKKSKYTDDDLLDDVLMDESGVDTSFFTFLRSSDLIFYSMFNFIFLSFCVYSIFTPIGFDSLVYLFSIYMLNNLWLFLSYFSWRSEVIEENKRKHKNN